MNDDSLATLAARYPLVLVPAGEKGPKKTDWHLTPVTPDQAAKIGNRNIGLILGESSGVVDFDCDGPQAEASLRRLFDGELPSCPRFVSSRGRHYLCAWSDRLAGLGAVVKSAEYPDLEIRLGAGKGAQTLIPPSQTNGFMRSWEVSILDLAPPMLPECVIDRIAAMGTKKQDFDSSPDDFLGNVQNELQRAKIDKLQKYFARTEVPASLVRDYKRVLFRFGHCPLRGPEHTDGAAVVYVNADGSHAFDCKHAKCAGKTFDDIELEHGSIDPVVKLSHDLAANVQETIAAMASADNLYQRAGCLVRVTRDAPKPRLCLVDNGSTKLSPLVPATIAPLLTTCAKFERFDAKSKKWKRCLPPASIVAAVHAATDLPGIAPIFGIVNCPVLRADGSILTKPGYDGLTGLYLDCDGEFPPLMEPAEARDCLDDVLADFPFASPSHKSGAIACLVTMLARPAFSGASPMFVVDANVSRAGKGLLTDLFTIIAQGRKATRFSPPGSDDEFRKVVTSAALAGASYLLFDNCKGTLGGQAIENAITTGRWSDRLLGVNKSVDIELSWVWEATANNAVLTTDMIGRTCHIRLDVRDEQPELRSGFRHDDLLAYALKHRRALAMAALSIPAGYIAAGRPDQRLPAWGGFSSWSDLVRGSLVWAGLADPGDTRKALRAEADDETSQLRALMAAWAELPAPMMTVANAMQAVSESGLYGAPTLYPLFQAFIDDLPGSNKKSALGLLLRKHRRQVVGGKCFDKAGGDPPRWTLVAA